MAGLSLLPSGRPSSLRRTELRLGEPEPPAKKRIIDVAVLVEPVQLARVSGYRAMCAARCRPLASLVEVVGARRQAFARSLSGRRRQGRRWLEWLPVASRQGSAAARRGRAARSSARRVFSHVQRSTRSGSAWDCAIFTLCCRLCSRLLSAASLAQECVQRSLLALSGCAVTAGMKFDKTR